MAKLSTLTIEQAKKAPAAFLYVWASEEFLNAIPAKHARIIRGKKANQRKLLLISADEYKTTLQAYTDAIYAEFKDMYNMTPFEALLVLAQGGTVAGKNWEKGVYGIGAVKVTTFYGADGLTVNESTGDIMLNGQAVTANSKTVYSNVKGKAVAYQKFYTDANGKTYMAQYDKSTGKYYASTISDADGNMISAANGKSVTAADGGDLWGNITLLAEKFLNWLLSLFNKDGQKESLSEENTLPSQTGDGFVTGDGTMEAGGILLLLAAGGAIIAGSAMKGKKKSK